MNFFKLIFLALLLMLAAKVSMADSHDVEQNIIDKAKEINQNNQQFVECFWNQHH